jgi:hypothetical protein
MRSLVSAAIFLALCACGGGAPDPKDVQMTAFSIAAPSSETRCDSEAAHAWAVGSRVQVDASFLRPCHGFFGFGDSCRPLTGVAFDVSPDSGWSSTNFVPSVNGHVDDATIDLVADSEGEVAVAPQANGISFAPLRLSALKPSTGFRLERLLRGSVTRFEKIESIKLLVGTKVGVVASAAGATGTTLCGQPTFEATVPDGAVVETATGSADAPRLNTPIAIRAVRPATSVISLSAGAAKLEVPVEVVQHSAISSVSIELRARNAARELRLRALAGTAEVDGVQFHVVNRSPELISLIELNDSKTELDPEEPVVQIRLLGSPGVAKLGVTVKGSGAPERVVEVTIPAS